MTFCLNTCVEPICRNCTAVFIQIESRLLASPHFHNDCVPVFYCRIEMFTIWKEIKGNNIASCYNTGKQETRQLYNVTNDSVFENWNIGIRGFKASESKDQINYLSRRSFDFKQDILYRCYRTRLSALISI